MRRSDPCAIPCLTFSVRAWLKLQYFCHAGSTEIAGFAISNPDRLLRVEDFLLVRQQSSLAYVDLDDQAVADFFDRCVDTGLKPNQFSRIWCHTHPGDSAEPSGMDEETFERCFGHCDWSVMFILARTGATYARLRYRVGPGTSLQIPVRVDWSTWPAVLDACPQGLAELHRMWKEEFEHNVQPLATEAEAIPWWDEPSFRRANIPDFDSFFEEPMHAFDPVFDYRP